MKKIIGIGVALALLTMAVVPGVVAAQIEPDTYAKVPFAIIGSGIELIGDVVENIPMIADALPEGFDIKAITDLVGPWTAGPLAWTVDMMAWGVHLGAVIWAPLDDAFDIGYPVIGDLLEDVACELRVCFSDVCSGNWTCP